MTPSNAERFGTRGPGEEGDPGKPKRGSEESRPRPVITEVVAA